MLTISSPSAMRSWSAAQHTQGSTIGLVPTMGALHDGHLALIAAAAERSDAVVVSIFVNPLQFDQSADFDSYPRPIDADVAVCERAGVAAVYAPTATVMYPTGFQTRVVPGPLGDVMEGPGRPGHFEGVLTVVAKLFGAVSPDRAVFGQKDYQQLRIVTQMVADLDMGIEIIAHPIVRDPDGVAQSSRNARLSTSDRVAARCVPQSLAAAATTAERSDDVDTIVGAARRIVDGEPRADHEYTAVFDAATLQPIDQLTPVHRHEGRVRIATAIWFGGVRLIDNRDLFAVDPLATDPFAVDH